MPGLPDGSDVVTPYGYGGPVAAGDAAPVERFWASYERWCAERRVVSTFVRFHPLLGNHRHAGRAMRVERIGSTVGWRLRAEDDLLEGMHRHHRRVVRKALAARVEAATEVAPAALDDFVALYESTMARKRAAGFYFFPEPYWRALSGALREHVVRFDATRDGELLASVLCLVGGRWLHYHLGASNELGRALGAPTVVLYEAARWGRARGFEEFHLGGGIGGRADSLLEFKRRFSPEGLRDMYVGKAVHEADVYRALTGDEDVRLDGFFPAYRRPRAASQV